MAETLHIVNWQSVLTEHQAWTLRAFAALPDVELAIVTARDEIAARRAQGWTPPDLAGLDVTALPGHGWFAFGRNLILARPHAHHLFCGLWADRRLFILMLYAWWRGCKLALLSEPYSDTTAGLLHDQHPAVGRLKIFARKILWRAAGLLLGRRMSPLFAISPKAAAQFTRAGFKPQAICPFGYFVPRVADVKMDRPPRGDRNLRLVFVATLIRRKGLDIALQAIATVSREGIDISLDVYGPGNTRELPPTDPRIRYCGVISFGDAQRVIADYDAVIVPSRFDGWSVVVNEALLQGVPVLVSSAAGAAAMVQKQRAGFVFDPARPGELAAILARIAGQPALLDAARERALAFRDQLAPEIAARYLHDCFNAMGRDTPRPVCPWY